MAKVVLDAISSGYDLSKVNANFQLIEDELNDKVLYRDNPVGEVNTIITDVDVNGKVLYNLPTPTLSHQAVPKGYADSQSALASGFADDAEASAIAAALSETNAANSEAAADQAVIDATEQVVLATAAAVDASASAANLPNATTAGASKYLKSNATADGWVYNTPAEVLIDIGAESADATILKDADIGVSVQAYDATIVVDADIGVSVQAYDADTAKLDNNQSWPSAQRSGAVTDNDGSFDLSGAGNNYSCTPAAGLTLTFTNIAAQANKSGYITWVNGSNYAIAAHTNTLITTADLAAISVTGTHVTPYLCDGTDVMILGVWTKP